MNLYLFKWIKISNKLLLVFLTITQWISQAFLSVFDFLVFC
ncbi:hypothetical protein C5167_050898 [Papaver somniferum]|uniref:Uncharacterized protein n=1 Tax=Papaver somniferum TaxID=3469 RepID=A0A4Y7KRG4_PAPSO|nr:hypothetical protein C5167_050898 [Papaver somniferum]